MACKRTDNHYCKDHTPPNEGFCGAPHPAGKTPCRRLAGHEGEHGAFTVGISVPERWT